MDPPDILQQLKVYCPKHNSAFDTISQREITCEIFGESLAHDFPHGELWEYCCLCQTHWPSDLTQGNKLPPSCPRCDREIGRRFYCHLCETLAHDSDEATRGKPFWINEKGAVEPNCPSCQRSMAGPLLHAHQCNEVGGVFTTAREVCPLCRDTVVKPIKPTVQTPVPGGSRTSISVGDFVRQVPYKASIARIDYATGKLVEDAQDDGPFLIIPCGENTDYSFIIPRYEKLRLQNEFYAYYEKLYNCAHPSGGDVYIVTPAIVTRSDADGWTLHEKGELEIKPDVMLPPRSGRVFYCPQCGRKGDARESFCGGCGKSMSSSVATETGDLPTISPEQLQSLVRCPICSHLLRPGSSFCANCGIDATAQSNQRVGAGLPYPSPSPSGLTSITSHSTDDMASPIVRKSSGAAGKALLAIGLLAATGIVCSVLLSGNKADSNNNGSSTPISTNNRVATPSPTPNVVGWTGKLVTNLNVRKCADKTCALIAEQFQGARVKVLETRQKENGAIWYRVEVLKFGCHANNPNWCGKKWPRGKEDRDRAYEIEGDDQAADMGWIISENTDNSPTINWE